MTFRVLVGMAGTQVKIKDIIIDCCAPARLGAFWAEVLGRPVAARMGPYVWLARGDGPGVGFQKVEGPKAGKNRVHFDITAPDPAAEREGARRECRRPKRSARPRSAATWPGT